jgi:rare lipoprotein A
MLAATAVALSAPALASAASGGAGVRGALGAAPAKNDRTLLQAANGTVSATGNGITIVSEASGFLRDQVQFTGSVPQADAGAVVEIERLGHETNWTWAPTAHATAGADGSFTVVWHANHIGRFSIRAVVDDAGASHAGSASPTVTVVVYRMSLATEYGPGFYGRTTACGTVLKRATIGVANRTLKCGTEVAIYYRGRTIMAPVIDRGPFANNADWDLTMATGQKLGMGGTDTIGAVSLPPKLSTPSIS